MSRREEDEQPRPGLAETLAADDRFQAANVLSPGAFLDAGLPLLLFTAVYLGGGRNLTVALWTALASGAVLVVIRLLRREPLQNVVAGFVGLALAAFLAARSGQAEDVFLLGILTNIGYGVAYLVSIVVRWPLLGILVGFVTGQGTSWRKDRRQLRAYTLASALWVGMFALRLSVQLPLYLAGEEHLGWLATARLAMSWPLFLLVAYLSWVIIRPAYRAYQERERVASGQPAESGQRPDVSG